MKNAIDDLLDSLKFSYIEYIQCKTDEYNPNNLAYFKGYCIVLEDILVSTWNVKEEHIKEIRSSILGDTILERVTRENMMLDIEYIEK